MFSATCVSEMSVQAHCDECVGGQMRCEVRKEGRHRQIESVRSWPGAHPETRVNRNPSVA